MEEATNNCQRKSHLVVGIFLIFVLIALTVFLAMETRNALKKFDYIGKAETMQNTISISGEGKVTAVPDIANISIGLTTEKSKVAEAQAENTKIMNEIIAAIKQYGVGEKDVKTATYNINPKYSWLNGKNEISGYTVYQSVDIKVRDLKKISEIIKVAGEKGANQVGSLTFKVDKEEQLKEQARSIAIDEAKKKAEILAKQLGVKLGKVVNFIEYETSPLYGAKYYPVGADGMGGGGESSPSIEAGENEIKMQATIVYEIL
jgi:uncharacterized protein YggE